jgi:hypothetical protein
MNWIDRFFALFRDIEPALNVVLNASSCREGWIQGEFYRRFLTVENEFEVNCSGWTSAKIKHDLYSKLPTEMVAELKVYGQWEYARKNLFGAYRIADFVPTESGQRIDVTLRVARDRVAAVAATGSKEWKNSFFQDFIRLQDVPPEVERYLILVLLKAEQADEFGQAIGSVRVSANEWDLDLERFLVRVWRV